MAIEEGHDRIVAALLEYRANHGHVDESKNSALMYAAQRRRVSIMHRLLQAGAEANLQNCVSVLWAFCCLFILTSYYVCSRVLSWDTQP
ncbi:ankyrin repeat domain-containing protein [archaeon]|nr:MAG: ankyrin repeat domain-containing protein [archaeon]